ncbi:hypothetical protein Q3G72_002319 [Acer saccharum]|nr:hypothetical protein Q3G72_002319 [Acer saccharum]
MAPVAVLTREELFSKEQRAMFKDKLTEGFFGGPETGGKMMLLEGKTMYQQLSLPPADAQLIENRQFGVETLCRWWNVPPAMIGHGTAVSNWGTGREQINLGFLQYVLMPYIKRIELGIKKSLLRPEDRRKYYAEYSVEGLLRADSAGRATFYASAVQNGWMTRNEVRSLENWASKEGGDDLTVQSNMIPVSLLGKGTTSTDAINNLKNLLGIEDKNAT